MSSEYIRIESQDRNYAERVFLSSQMNLLNTIKNLKEYKKLRKEEIILKISLTALLEETLQEISVLDKILPRTQPKEKISFPIQAEEKEEVSESMSINRELEIIKQKLLRLQSN